MKWQEYQEATVRLFEQMKGIGDVRRSFTVPDKVTGQPRQVDAGIFVEAKGCHLFILVDAKFYKDKVDVRDVESVLALADAVGANKAVLVSANGWTEPAETKARFANMELMLLSVEHALDLIVEEKWALCPSCERDCIVLEHERCIMQSGLSWIFLAGQCRECRLGWVWCWDCGEQFEFTDEAECGCGHSWHLGSDGFYVRPAGHLKMVGIAELT